MRFSAQTAVSWRQKSKSTCVPREFPKPQAPHPLPDELWRSIIGFGVRCRHARSIDLPDPLAQTSYVSSDDDHWYDDFRIFSDRKSFRLVSRYWRDIVDEISSEYQVIESNDDLITLIKLLEGPNAKGLKKKKMSKRIITTLPPKCIGSSIKRLDLSIQHSYDPQYVVRVLHHTPNLLIFLNKNGPPTAVRNRRTPTEILDALPTLCPNLLRLDWASPGEPPRLEDVVQVCNALPFLKTLRLTGIRSYPVPTPNHHLRFIMPNLRTLSLNYFPQPVGEDFVETYALTWAPFFATITGSVEQLPLLSRFECDPLSIPLNSISPSPIPGNPVLDFFKIHGHKLKHLKVAAWEPAHQLRPNRALLPELLPYCPNLRKLVLTERNPPSESLTLPWNAPGCLLQCRYLEQICIMPFHSLVIDGPRHLMEAAIIKPLDELMREIEESVTPPRPVGSTYYGPLLPSSRVREIRIHNAGPLEYVMEYPSWLRFWWRRWNIIGSLFSDRSGISFWETEDQIEGFAPFSVSGKAFSTWYKVLGDVHNGRRPLVVIHGGPGLTHQYMLIPIVFYDQLGSGQSSHYRKCPQDFWTPSLFSDQLETLLKHLKIHGNYDILGHSWGGFLAAYFACHRKPPGLQRLILANAPASIPLMQKGLNILLDQKGPEFAAMMRQHEAHRTMHAREYQAGISLFISEHLCDMEPWPPDLQESFAVSDEDETVHNQMMGRKTFQVEGTLKDESTVAYLFNITAQTLVINSDKDEMHDICVKPFADHIPDVRWFKLKKSTHVPMFEEPESYFQLLSGFLA
ncbi:hypothetical protein CVT24_002073 [Panaeolus cyanescens]|uniref:AB hydrolase-1 domain-containing protein n=1 Tax=Panaeolus cyanescens TaxID=181874 RepID=A0A409W1N4_9AGAR|nr:hypothetical protein CVT24_002073 [Panaeolus cyanescens]